MSDGYFYVRSGLATGDNDGSSWANAYDSIETAIDNLSSDHTLTGFDDVIVFCASNGTDYDDGVATNTYITTSNFPNSNLPLGEIHFKPCDGATGECTNGTDEKATPVFDFSKYYISSVSSYDNILGGAVGSPNCNFRFDGFQFRVIHSNCRMFQLFNDAASYYFDVVNCLFSTNQVSSTAIYMDNNGGKLLQNNIATIESGGRWHSLGTFNHGYHTTDHNVIVINNTSHNNNSSGTIGFSAALDGASGADSAYYFNNVSTGCNSSCFRWTYTNSIPEYGGGNLSGDSGENRVSGHVSSIVAATETDVYNDVSGFPYDLSPSTTNTELHAGEGINITSGDVPPRYLTTDMLGNEWGSDWGIGAVRYAAGGGGITGAGVLQAQSSAVSGAGEREITGSGGLDIQPSVVSGVGSSGGTVTGSGDIDSSDSDVDGVGFREITGLGSPASNDSDVDGSGSREITGSGGVDSGDSSVASTGYRAVTGSGSPQSNDSDVSGAGDRAITGSGTPDSDDSSVSGVGERAIVGSGGIDSGDSDVSGVGANNGAIVGSGDIDSDDSQASGTGERTITGSGAPTADDADVSGSGGLAGNITGLGDVDSDDSSVSGSGSREITGSGAPSAEDADVLGVAARVITGAGTSESGDSDVSGIAERAVTGSGDASSNDSLLSGAGSRKIVGSGTIIVGDASMIASGFREITGSGVLICGNSVITGSDIALILAKMSGEIKIVSFFDGVVSITTPYDATTKLTNVFDGEVEIK